MRYKVKVTKLVGEISEILELETDDKDLVREIFSLELKKEQDDKVPTKITIDGVSKDVWKRKQATFKGYPSEVFTLGTLGVVEDSYAAAINTVNKNNV
ncbi:MAG: hypothetical protein KGZ89_07730 [Actinobacteria bacterium]|nr:hypothetical protein [Actinomycetota bacterium]